MRDSLGGLVSIFIIVVFVVLIMGYLAFNVNYTKAFRMRDKVIDTLNVYDGDCDDACKKEINDYAKEIGYPRVTRCSNGEKDETGYYCYVRLRKDNDAGMKTFGDKTFYYEIYTKTSIDIPVVNNLLKLNESLGELKGITKTFVENNKHK